MKLVSNQVTVLDIQEKHVKCSQLIYHEGKWSIYKSLQEELPPSDKNQDSNYDTVHIIKTMLQEMVEPKYLIVSISGRDVSIKLLNLPPINEKKSDNMEGVIKYELGTQLPISIDQMYYDYQIVEMDGQITKVLTASIKRSVLNRYIEILSQSGVIPDIITISSTALFNAFVMSGQHRAEQPIGLVCLRESTGDVAIIERGNLTYARSFNITENNTIREINNSFDAYFKMPSLKVDLTQMAIYLISPDEENQHPDLTGVMPNVNLQWHKLPNSHNFIHSLAMSGVSNPANSHFLRINLLNQVIQEKQEAKRKETKARLFKFAPAISMTVLLIISCILWWQVREEKNKLRIIETELQTSVKQSNDTTNLKDIGKKLDKQIESLDWVMDEYPMVSYRLYKIAQMVPNSVWLKEVYIPESRMDKKKKQDNPINKINVSGYAHKQDQVELFLDNIRKCDCFSEVRQEGALEVSLNGEKVLEFEIGLISSKIE
jgi:Tfp pilus assembly protein PilN